MKRSAQSSPPYVYPFRAPTHAPPLSDPPVSAPSPSAVFPWLPLREEDTAVLVCHCNLVSAAGNESRDLVGEAEVTDTPMMSALVGKNVADAFPVEIEGEKMTVFSFADCSVRSTGLFRFQFRLTS